MQAVDLLSLHELGHANTQQFSCLLVHVLDMHTLMESM